VEVEFLKWSAERSPVGVGPHVAHRQYQNDANAFSQCFSLTEARA